MGSTQRAFWRDQAFVSVRYGKVPNTERASELKVMAGLRLKAARLALGVERQDVMANVLGVQPSAYNNWEKGVRLPDVAAMTRLLHRAGISLDWIFAGELRSMPFDLATKLQQNAVELGAAIATPVSLSPNHPTTHRELLVHRKPPRSEMHERQEPI